ncbi:MAG: hypothetical protein ACMVP2_17930 [Imperialibacter sp.]|uniref:hypothetical protein n=1 Tax=Imperialibacter sp. TaxID=2038411 RepID=UPI003A89FA4E
MKTIFFSSLLIFLAHTGSAQRLTANFFARTPQLVNYNFKSTQWSYTPLVSAGMGLSKGPVFLELASFINSSNVVGYYTFFGGIVSKRQLDNATAITTSCFGEVTHIPAASAESVPLWIETSGVCFTASQQIGNINIGFPVCVGMAYSGQAFSLNTRIMLNVSMQLPHKNRQKTGSIN